MSASGNLNKTQFVHISEIRKWDSSDWPGKSVGQMLDKPNANRLMNSQRTGDRYTQHAELRDSIAQHGVRSPLEVSNATSPPTLVGGHHRLYAGTEAGLDTFPVKEFRLRK